MNGIKEYGSETCHESFPFGELSDFQNRNRFISETIQLQKHTMKELNASQYLSSVQSFIPKELISTQNYTEMKNLASYFNGAITSFFGFESRLNSSEGRADYLFAVSSKRGEREALANLIRNRTLPEEFTDKPEWQNACRLVLDWANPDSVLYNNVLGLWFEFDMVENSLETPIPCIFLHTIPLQMNSTGDGEKLHWLTKTTLPAVTGRNISEKIEQNLINAIQKLPMDALIMDAGVMLSRPTSGVRLIIARISPIQIIPYLTQMGWSEESEQLPLLLKELEQNVSRVVLHITITDAGIDQKIGLECSFAPDLYNLETRWSSFFNYLINKGLCLPEKKDTLLQFIGVELEDPNRGFNTTYYKPTVKIQNEEFSSALVRFISHIKIVYEPNHALTAKAYPGVRLFGCPHNP